MRTWAFVVFVSLTTSMAQAGGLATRWEDGHNYRNRMVMGASLSNDGHKQLVIGLEIDLKPGWKTYWRSPGDAGGIPPNFNWSKSRNLKSATVLYPAPKRFTDSTGTTIGYKHNVVIPVLIEPHDPSKPVGIALNADYGVCREICVPAQARIAAEVSLAQLAALPPQLAKALAQVPVPAAKEPKGKRPNLVSARITTGAKPALVFDVAFPGGAAGADLFAEAVPSQYLPMVKPLGRPRDGRAQFALDLRGDVSAQQIRGKRLRLTIVSDAGSSETEIVVK